MRSQETSAPFVSFREFFKLESTGGMILFNLPVQIGAGDLDLNKPLMSGLVGYLIPRRTLPEKSMVSGSA